MLSRMVLGGVVHHVVVLHQGVGVAATLRINLPEAHCMLTSTAVAVSWRKQKATCGSLPENCMVCAPFADRFPSGSPAYLDVGDDGSVRLHKPADAPSCGALGDGQLQLFILV